MEFERTIIVILKGKNLREDKYLLNSLYSSGFFIRTIIILKCWIKIYNSKYWSQMKEVKRTDNYQQLRQVSSTPRLLRSKQNRDSKPKMFAFRPKQTFLTDNQTDQTKSSNEAKPADIERLQYTIRKLQRENNDLRQTILKMKTAQFYGINQEKVKKLIKQNQSLKGEIKVTRKELQKILIEKDFLERNNRILKEKYEEFTKENNKPVIQSRMRTEFAQLNDYEFLDDVEEFFNKENRPSQKQKRSVSSEKSKMVKKKTNGGGKPEEKSNPEGKKLREGGHKLNEEYYISRQGKMNRKHNYQ